MDDYQYYDFQIKNVGREKQNLGLDCRYQNREKCSIQFINVDRVDHEMLFYNHTIRSIARKPCDGKNLFQISFQNIVETAIVYAEHMICERA